MSTSEGNEAACDPDGLAEAPYACEADEVSCQIDCCDGNEDERGDIHGEVQDGVDAVTGSVEGDFYYEKGGGLLKVDLVPSVEQINVEGTEYFQKPEAHVSLIPAQMKLDKIVKAGVDNKKIAALLREPMELDDATVQRIVDNGPSNKQIKNALKLVLPAAAQGLSFQVKPRDEYRLVDKGESRTVIQMCDVEGADQYYRNVEALLGLAEGQIKPVPYHITLFTGENGKGIGLASEEQLDELSRPVYADVVKAAL